MSEKTQTSKQPPDKSPDELREDLPVNLREILKRQPYVVVERMTEEADHSKNRPVLHLTNAERSFRQVSLCGKRFDSATHIPLESWGKLDRVWCRTCMFMTRNSVKNKLKKQIEEHRKAAAADSAVPPVPQSSGKKSGKSKETKPASADQS